MTKRSKKIEISKLNLILLIVTVSIITSAIIITNLTHAGPLVPSNTISPQGYTLADIYRRLTTNTPAIASNHSLSTTSNPQSTQYTLSQIYDAIPTIDPTKVLTGTTYLGIAGTANPNGGGTGAGQLVWTDYLDIPATTPNNPFGYDFLAWSGQYGYYGSSPQYGNGTHLYNGINLGASEYCSYLSQDGVNLVTNGAPPNIWRLPTKDEAYLRVAMAGADDAILEYGTPTNKTNYFWKNSALWTSDTGPYTSPIPNKYEIIIDPYGSFMAYSISASYKYGSIKCVHN